MKIQGNKVKYGRAYEDVRRDYSLGTDFPTPNPKVHRPRERVFGFYQILFSVLCLNFKFRIEMQNTEVQTTRKRVGVVKFMEIKKF